MASEPTRPRQGGSPNDAQSTLTSGDHIPLGHALDLLLKDPDTLTPSLRKRIRDFRDGERLGHERGYANGFAEGYRQGYEARGDWDD